MKIYQVFVTGYNDVTRYFFNEFVEAFETKDTAEEYVKAKTKEVEDIHEKLKRQDYACVSCDHEDKCRYCDWNETINTCLEFITSNNKTIEVDCDLYHGDNPVFELKEINLL